MKSCHERNEKVLHSLLFSSPVIEQITRVASMIVYIMLPNFTHHISKYTINLLSICIKMHNLPISTCSIIMHVVYLSSWISNARVLMHSNELIDHPFLVSNGLIEFIAQTIHPYMSKVTDWLNFRPKPYVYVEGDGWAHMPIYYNGHKVFTTTTMLNCVVSAYSIHHYLAIRISILTCILSVHRVK